MQKSFGSHKSLVLIIDGIDLFKESSGTEESAEWLPFVLPEAVKIIYTCNTSSKAYTRISEKCKNLVLSELTVSNRKKILKEFLARFPDMQKSENLIELKQNIKNDCCANQLYLKMIII